MCAYWHQHVLKFSDYFRLERQRNYLVRVNWR